MEDITAEMASVTYLRGDKESFDAMKVIADELVKYLNGKGKVIMDLVDEPELITWKFITEAEAQVEYAKRKEAAVARQDYEEAAQWRDLQSDKERFAEAMRMYSELCIKHMNLKFAVDKVYDAYTGETGFVTALTNLFKLARCEE
jgi:hypothetical protein